MTDTSIPTAAILNIRFTSIGSPVWSSGYSQSAALLAHNLIAAMAACQVECILPDISKSPPWTFLISLTNL